MVTKLHNFDIFKNVLHFNLSSALACRMGSNKIVMLLCNSHNEVLHRLQREVQDHTSYINES